MYNIIHETNGKENEYTVIDNKTWKPVSPVYNNHADAMIRKFELEHENEMQERIPYGFIPKTI